MRDSHEPRKAFVERLALDIQREARLRQRRPEPVGWWRPMTFRAALTAAVVVLLSMAVGAAAVAAAYQVQNNEQRDQLVSNFTRRLQLARERVAIVAEQLRTAEQRVAVGLAEQDTILEARVKVAEAEAQVRSLELQVQEVQATSREPRNEITAPLVAGRDFVGDRWKVDLEVPLKALEFEKARVQSAERRFNVGTANAVDIEMARARLAELEVAIDAIRRKLTIRQGFIKGEFDAAIADLLALEAVADQQRKAVLPKLASMKLHAADMAVRVDTGTAAMLDLQQVKLRLLELEVELSRLDVELTVIRRQLLQRRGK